MNPAMNLETSVLLVDDYVPVRRTLRGLLLQIGFRNIDDTSDVASALAKLRERTFGLIISDLKMEPTTGLDFLREVRADERLRSTPFIMVTALGDAESVKAAKEAGVDNYIVKPFNTVTLKKKIGAVLGPAA
jgi:two-component system chemotaxis response regulator CheY